jgi:5-bromo-4-chloroindolyl phosphate hydrolysis protein
MPRGKTNAIEQLINGKYAGATEITVKQLASEVNCTVQNVYIYVRKNPTRFTQIRRGVYQINPSIPTAVVTNSNNTSSLTA